MFTDIYNTTNRYELILADPPWKQSKGGLRKSRPNQTRKLDYDTLSLADIKDIQMKVMPAGGEKQCVFMWTIDKYLHESEQMMLDLGYKLHARFIWDKTNGVAPAFTVRYSHEFLLWFYINGLLPIDKQMRGKYTTVFSEKATTHSTKPEVAYEIIESLYPNSSRLEMYARRKRDGWDCWGNEAPKEV